MHAFFQCLLLHQFHEFLKRDFKKPCEIEASQKMPQNAEHLDLNRSNVNRAIYNSNNTLFI
jgi:hypothetical protein